LETGGNTGHGEYGLQVCCLGFGCGPKAGYEEVYCSLRLASPCAIKDGKQSKAKKNTVASLHVDCAVGGCVGAQSVSVGASVHHKA
jgi:hypothetical protein